MEKKIYLRKKDWIVDKKEPTFVAQVLDITDFLVVCDCISFPINQISEYRHWNLLDAKEGEVLVKNNQDSSKTIFIYGGITKKDREFFIDYHYRVDIDGDICIHGINKGDTIGPLSTNVVPANNTESRILYSRFMNDRYRYNPHTHTVTKIDIEDKKKEKVTKHFNKAWQ
jgi:hypothetical protein